MKVLLPQVKVFRQLIRVYERVATVYEAINQSIKPPPSTGYYLRGMAYQGSFEDIFGRNADVTYEQKTLRKIGKNKQELENTLFIDRLLTAVGIQHPSRYYPPDSHRRLRDLYEQISSSASPEHHKKSVLYYLLKDLPQGGCKSPEDFATVSYLPEKYKILVDGLWCLDRLQFERALDYLTEPSLIPTFPEEILNTLCRASLASENSSDKAALLPIAYYQAVSPPIRSSSTLERYCDVLCKFSVTEALVFSRSQGAYNHQVLFERLLYCALSKWRTHQHAIELVGLPLDEEEEAWLIEYLGNGKGSKLPTAEDTLIMREIAAGRMDRLRYFRRTHSGRNIEGLDWDTIGDLGKPSTADQVFPEQYPEWRHK
ncbi:MAG: hypothetical protein Q9163_000693 [Psora crenata]